MEFLTDLLDSTTIPVLSAFLLGLMTAFSPCPLATNITAIGYISKDIEKRGQVFISGLLYTTGRAITYTGLAFIIYLGADQMKISGFFQRNGEKIIGPLLVIIGILLLDVIRARLPEINLSRFLTNRKGWRYTDALLLGLVFALAFCPYSGVLYFGMLVPMTISADSGFLLPLLYAVATGIPVIIVAWIIAFSVAGIGRFYNTIRAFERWFRKVVALLFIGVGLYYILRIYIIKV